MNPNTLLVLLKKASDDIQLVQEAGHLAYTRQPVARVQALLSALINKLEENTTPLNELDEESKAAAIKEWRELQERELR